MTEIVITSGQIRAYAFGLVNGLLLIGAVWFGTSLHTEPDLIPLAVCDEKGWRTVRFPGGGEFTCTPTEQKPVASQPVIRKPKRLRRQEAITPLVPLE